MTGRRVSGRNTCIIKIYNVITKILYHGHRRRRRGHRLPEKIRLYRRLYFMYYIILLIQRHFPYRRPSYKRTWRGH